MAGPRGSRATTPSASAARGSDDWLITTVGWLCGIAFGWGREQDADLGAGHDEGHLMKAVVGDRIRVPGRHVGDAVRCGEVIDVRGAEGQPPYDVRWDDGHEAVCFPGPETKLEHVTPR